MSFYDHFYGGKSAFIAVGILSGLIFLLLLGSSFLVAFIFAIMFFLIIIVFCNKEISKFIKKSNARERELHKITEEERAREKGRMQAHGTYSNNSNRGNYNPFGGTLHKSWNRKK